jgi:serine/threonine-protein kinase ULK2
LPRHSSSFEKEKYNVGSPLYMSPEALKKNIYSIKNDIWSIGIMIYEMLHGETPWECRTESELIDKMTKIPVRFKETISVSKEVKEFIRKCLEIDETKRMGLSDLREWISKAEQRPKTHSLQEKKLSPPAIHAIQD